MAKRTRAVARGKPASKNRLTHQRNGGQEIGAEENTPQKNSRRAVRQKTTCKTMAGISRTANAIKARRLVFTPETVAYVRHLYEQTDASLGEIAIDLRVHKDTVRRLAKRGGWSRYVRPPRALSTAAQLVVQTSELEAKYRARLSLRDGLPLMRRSPAAQRPNSRLKKAKRSSTRAQRCPS